MEKVKEELDIQVGKKRCVNESDIDKLVYLQAIVKETLRLYPSGPLSGPREFSENCIVGGYNVIKGTRLITNLWKIQTDPSIWQDPLEFKLERFLTTHKDIDVREAIILSYYHLEVVEEYVLEYLLDFKWYI
jgi:cytochrome P450